MKIQLIFKRPEVDLKAEEFTLKGEVQDVFDELDLDYSHTDSVTDKESNTIMIEYELAGDVDPNFVETELNNWFEDVDIIFPDSNPKYKMC